MLKGVPVVLGGLWGGEVSCDVRGGVNDQIRFMRAENALKQPPACSFQNQNRQFL